MKTFSNSSDEDLKQHIGFSQYAYTILKEDHSIFNTDNSPLSWDAFLNKIIQNYQDLKLYPANINHQFDTLLRDFFKELKPISEKQFDKIKDAFKKAYTDAHEAGLKRTIPNKLSKTFNISKLTLQRIGSMKNSLEAKIFERPGKYFSAIFESYARKPFIEREQIILCDQLEKIKQAIKKNVPINFLHANGKHYDFLPYALSPDKMGSYWYVAGIIMNEDGTRYYSSFRVSRLLEIYSMQHNFTPLSKGEKQNLEKMISEKGIQFLVGHSTKAIIRLTPNGYKKYLNQLHRRPQIVSEISPYTYEFNATLEQLEYYFFSFGTDAEILEPQELRNSFLQKYQQAAKLYTE